MPQLNYKHLRYFWAVAREGNLTRAAEGLALSQSALSTQIRSLERSLGHDLFERSGRTLHLTEAGRIALDHANAIFASGDELVGTLTGASHARKILKVGALSTLSRNFQLRFLAPLLARQDVELVLRSGSTPTLLASLETLGLDVVLTNAEPSRDAATKLRVRRLAEQHVGLFGTPARLDGRDDIAALLQDQPIIVPPVDSGIRARFDDLCARLGVHPQIAAEVDDMAMVRLLAREDVGLAVVPPIVVRDEVEAGILRQAPFELDIVESFLAVTVQRRFQSPLLEELLTSA